MVNENLGKLVDEVCFVFEQLFVSVGGFMYFEVLFIGIVFDCVVYCLCKCVGYEFGVYFVFLLSCIFGYKGMVMMFQLELFYFDLQDECFVFEFVVVYFWYLMNIFLLWLFVQLLWMFVYNGEINMVGGNCNWMWV